MKYVLDTHTHTVVSGHAYTTWLENVKHASDIGLKILGTTDHGPKMPGGPHEFYFNNLKALPRRLYGVLNLRGCEANIINYNGDLDISKDIQNKLDIVIASLHDVCIDPSSEEEHTQALLKVMDNDNVHIIGHMGNASFPADYEEVIKKAKKKDILIEINNSSFISRPGSYKNCLKIAKLCKKYGVKVIIGSDAHTCFQIGQFSRADELLKKIEMPEELIMNLDEKKIIRYLKNRGKLSDVNLD